MITDHAHVFAFTLLVAVAYLGLLRLMDYNEREPVWCLALLFTLGFGVALLLRLLVQPALLELHPVWGPALKESAKAAAIWSGLSLLIQLERWRGWSEVNGLLDGAVYGAAAGLGFAVGETFVRELWVGFDVPTRAGVSVMTILWASSMAGLWHGVFGAIIGAGFAAFTDSRWAARTVSTTAAAVVASLTHAGSLRLSAMQPALAMFIPFLFFLLLIAYALWSERRIISHHLSAELDTGVVTATDLALLRSFWLRQWTYVAAFFRGDLQSWAGLQALHHRQAQLALAKEKLLRGPDSTRSISERRVANLRAAVSAIRSGLRTIQARS